MRNESERYDYTCPDYKGRDLDVYLEWYINRGLLNMIRLSNKEITILVYKNLDKIKPETKDLWNNGKEINMDLTEDHRKYLATKISKRIYYELQEMVLNPDRIKSFLSVVEIKK